MKLTVCMAETQNFPENSESCWIVRAPSCRVLLYLLATLLSSGVYGELVSWIAQSLLHKSWNSFLIYSPPLSILILFTVSFFCLDNHAMYQLTDSEIVHSLFLRKSILANLALYSSQVMSDIFWIVIRFFEWIMCLFSKWEIDTLG